jgi:hypothetical protein
MSPQETPRKNAPAVKPAPEAPEPRVDQDANRGAPVRVRATKLGYYGNARRRVGDVFSIRSEHEFSAKWMERVPDETPERLTSGHDELEQQRQEHLRAQRERAGTPAPTPTGASAVLGE